MESRRQQLSGDDVARLQWLLGSVLALISSWSVFFMDVDAWLLLSAITAVALLGILRPAWPAAVPRWVHRLAFPAMLAAFAFDLYASREPLPALLRLDLLLILYRLMTHRRRREDLQLVVLGLFLIVVGGVLSVSLSFAVQIIAFTGCALAFLFLIHLADPAAAAASPSSEYPAAPAWTRGSWRELFRRVLAAMDWRLVALGAGLFAGLVVLSGLLFLAIPRLDFQSGLFLDRLISRQTFTGFSDTIEFGEVTAITEDNSLALTVDVEDRSAIPDVPYWRMVVLDEYTGRGFRVSPQLRRELDRASTRRVASGSGRFRPGAPGWTFYLEAGISRYVPLLGDFHRLVFSEPQTFGQHGPTAIVALQRDPPKMLAYQIRAMAPAAIIDAKLALARRGGERTGDYLDLPLQEPDRARLDRIVRPLREAGGDVHTFSEQAIGWLWRNHTYSLQSALPAGGGDPLVRWLDSATPGHCEYFAGSFVLLARAAGYPVRMVTGFKGGAWNAYSASFSVRNTHAHAWCEIFDDRTGTWVRADPTPGSGALVQDDTAASTGGGAARAETGWHARMESLRVFWYRRIVNFDQDSQLELASAAKQAMQQFGDRLRQWLDGRAQRFEDWLKRPWGLGRATVLAASVGLIVITGWWWMRVGRAGWLRWRSRRRHGTLGDPVRREAGRWLTRSAHRRSGDGEWPVELLRDLLRLRYGRMETWPEPAAVFRAARRAARAARRTAR